MSSTQEFYDKRVLQMTGGIEDMGSFSWELFGALVVAWVMVYFAIWKSVNQAAMRLLLVLELGLD